MFQVKKQPTLSGLEKAIQKLSQRRKFVCKVTFPFNCDCLTSTCKSSMSASFPMFPFQPCFPFPPLTFPSVCQLLTSSSMTTPFPQVCDPPPHFRTYLTEGVYQTSPAPLLEQFLLTAPLFLLPLYKKHSKNKTEITTTTANQL